MLLWLVVMFILNTKLACRVAINNVSAFVQFSGAVEALNVTGVAAAGM